MSELFKNSVVGWAAFQANSKPDNDFVNDRLLNNNTSSFIFDSKKEALKGGFEAIYGRWTFEQLQEPKDV